MSDITDYPERTIAEFVELLAAKNSVPGGGTLTAVVVAQAIAMAEMVCNFTLGKNRFKSVEGELDAVICEFGRYRKRALELSVQDARLYLKVKEFFSTNGYDSESVERDEVLIGANAAPLELLQIVNCSYRTVLGLAGKTNPNLDSDLNISLRLLDACKDCCAETLRINLNLIRDKQYIADTEAILNGGC